jgi:hypothetical protein
MFRSASSNEDVLRLLGHFGHTAEILQPREILPTTGAHFSHRSIASNRDILDRLRGLPVLGSS